MNKIEIYINGVLFKSIDSVSKIKDLYDARSVAQKFMNEKFKGYSIKEVGVSFFDADNGNNVSRIKVKSKELSRDIILEGLLKDGII